MLVCDSGDHLFTMGGIWGVELQGLHIQTTPKIFFPCSIPHVVSSTCGVRKEGKKKDQMMKFIKILAGNWRGGKIELGMKRQKMV